MQRRHLKIKNDLNYFLTLLTAALTEAVLELPAEPAEVLEAGQVAAEVRTLNINIHGSMP